MVLKGGNRPLRKLGEPRRPPARPCCCHHSAFAREATGSGRTDRTGGRRLVVVAGPSGPDGPDGPHGLNGRIGRTGRTDRAGRTDRTDRWRGRTGRTRGRHTWGHWLLGNLQQGRNQQKQHPTQRHGLEKHVHRLHTLRGDTLRTPAGNIRSTAEADVHKCRSGQTSPATSGDGSRGLGSCRCTCASQQEKHGERLPVSSAIQTGISGISSRLAARLLFSRSTPLLHLTAVKLATPTTNTDTHRAHGRSYPG